MPGSSLLTFWVFLYCRSIQREEGPGRYDVASKYDIYQKPSPVELRNAVDVF
jgi:hypothetical protein